MQEKITEELLFVLKQTSSDEIGQVLCEEKQNLFCGTEPFYNYIRDVLKHKQLTQQQVFHRAGFSERYGYGLLSGEKHTNQRDYILRICFAAQCSLEQTQRILRLYGMSTLYARIPRDAVFLVALNQKICEIEQVNALLVKQNMPPLKGSESGKRKVPVDVLGLSFLCRDMGENCEKFSQSCSFLSSASPFSSAS